MKRILTLPLAAFIVACSDSTAPLSPSAPDLRVSGTFNSATFTFDGSSLPDGYSISPGLTEISPSGEAFLGRFTNQAVTLEVPGGASSLLVSFNLYIIGSWDGAGGRRYGSDTWSVSASCQGSASAFKSFTTDFSNKVTTKQHFPNSVEGALNPGLTTADLNLLGYNGVLSSTHGKGSATDATYLVTFDLPSVPCTGPVDIVFSSPSQALQQVSDESWGLDNISISGS